MSTQLARHNQTQLARQTVCLFIVCIGQTVRKILAIHVLEVRRILRDLTFITISGLGKKWGFYKRFWEISGGEIALAFWGTQITNFLMWVSDRKACENRGLGKRNSPSPFGKPDIIFGDGFPNGSLKIFCNLDPELQEISFDMNICVHHGFHVNLTCTKQDNYFYFLFYIILIFLKNPLQ